MAPNPVSFDARANRLKASKFFPIPKPFSPKLQWDVSRSGQLAFTNGDNYAVTVLDSTGGVRKRLARLIAPRPVTATERDSVTDQLMNPGGRPSASKEYTGRARDLVAQLPLQHAAIDAIMFDEQSSALWIRRGGTRSDSTQWDYYSNALEYEGTLSLGRNSALIGVRSDTLVVLVRGSLGIPKLAWYAFNRAQQ